MREYLVLKSKEFFREFWTSKQSPIHISIAYVHDSQIFYLMPSLEAFRTKVNYLLHPFQGPNAFLEIPSNWRFYQRNKRKVCVNISTNQSCLGRFTNLTCSNFGYTRIGFVESFHNFWNRQENVIFGLRWCQIGVLQDQIYMKVTI